MLIKRFEKKLDKSFTRILRAISNKSWKQHPTKRRQFGHLPPISKTIQVRRTRHRRHYWRKENERISKVLQWNPTHGCASIGRPERTYLHQLCVDTGCSLKNQPRVMEDRDAMRERFSEIHAFSMTWWWYFY